MSDDQTNVDAGSETSGDQPTVVSPEEIHTTAEQVAADADQTVPPATDTPPSEVVQDAGVTADADESRTGFVTGARQGDACTCPDGRKGTVHKFDEGLVCIPNADQSE